MPTATTSTPVASGSSVPGVPDLALVEPPPEHADHVVAGHAGRLVDDA